MRVAVTIKGWFPSRRAAERAVEHMAQEYGIPRPDISVEPAGIAQRGAGAARNANAPEDRTIGPADADGAADGGPIIVSVDVNADEVDDVAAAFTDAGATHVDGGETR
jgi:hypothetical protein